MVTRYVEQPSLPPVVAVDQRYNNVVSEIPYSPTDRAWASAVDKMVTAYPGTQNTLKTLTRLKDQILKGEPAELGVQ